MSFAGGPWNNYPMHAIATMADCVREQPGTAGLCSGNGGYTTKHSFGVYGTTPPAEGYRHADLQSEVDATPRREAADDYDGPVVVESYTVMHDRDGAPETGLFALLTPDGGRCWGSTNDGDTVVELEATECVGRAASLAPDGETHLT